MNVLFQECSLAGLRVKNSFVRSATCENMADENGHVTERLEQIYVDLAKGDVGLIITGYANVLASDRPSTRMMGIYEDSFVSEYKSLNDAVHSFGSKMVMQLVFGGPQTMNVLPGYQLLGPSAVKDKFFRILPKQMTQEDIDQVVNAFADAAKRCQKAGFDGVQIHAAHGYLLSKFLTPYYNRRTDEYGGDIENRARIIFRVYEEIRKSVGQDYPVMIKINCSDFMPEGKGLTFEECLLVCSRLSQKGLDAIEVSGGSFSSDRLKMPARTQINKPVDESYFEEYAERIAEAVDCDVILVGGNRSIDVMEQIKRKTKIKAFALSRPLICEPDLIKQWTEKPQKRPLCNSCNKCFNPRGSVCVLRK